MTRIEGYLSKALDYTYLSDQEKCAICAAMDGEWVVHAHSYMKVNWIHTTNDRLFFDKVDFYFFDGNAVLKLLEGCRFFSLDRGYESELSTRRGWFCGDDIQYYGNTIAEAVVRAVCEFAKARWPYTIGVGEKEKVR